ncbi:MAG: ACT domain-containing protein [Lentisphaeria bacterium]
MKIRQLSVFLENRLGRLAGVTKILGDNDINIRALSVADTTGFGILRLIVDDIEKAEACLLEKEIVCRVNKVAVVAVDNHPRGLSKVLNILHASSINIEYMYAIAEPCCDSSLMVFRFTEPERATAVLKAADISTLQESDLFQE